MNRALGHASRRRWTRHFFQRSERTRTTWTFRIGLAATLVIAVWLTRGWWSDAVGSSLVCDRNVAPSDVILVENFDQDYLVFERARELRQRGVAQRVLVPVVGGGDDHANAVALAITELMARMARLGDFETLPVPETEPISLNAAREVRDYLQREGLRSVVVVSPLFRSRRSALVYDRVFTPAGITVSCEPVHGVRGVAEWDDTLHGIQNVAEQWLKLQYYRIYVLPFKLR